MSQRKTTLRHNLIINKLRKQKRATFSEICDYLQRESDIQGEDLTISKRTFTRDIAEIGEIYGIYIRYDFSARNYFIEEDFSEELQNRRLEALDVFNALKIKERQANHLFLDNRHTSGSEHLYGLLHSINNRFLISFSYRPFYHEDAVGRTVKPLAIKEFKHRWYLFAQDNHNEKVKCYGLDRMSNLQILQTVFVPPADFNLSERLRYSFGIVVPPDGEPSKVVLSFEPLQGKYVKSLPFHHSQQILADNADELRISLKIHITQDFIMEILSYGETVKVIEPKELITQLKSSYKKALKNY